MKITIIGSGNVATVLGRLLNKNRHTIEAVYGRSKTHAAQLAKELHAVAIDDISAISKTSDLYILAVKDDAVETISNQLHVDDKIVVHTGGSVSINVLKKASVNLGVLYPLQSLRKEAVYNNNIPFLIDANNSVTKDQLTWLANSITKNVGFATDEQRLHYHVSAIIVSNFTNHLFALAKQYCESNNIDFNLLLPLIEETVKRMHQYNPAEMQTGPAIRNDQSTIQKHLELLNDVPQLKNLYEVMSKSIMQSTK